MNFETYEKCRTIEAIDRVLDFLETDKFQKIRKTTENWCGDVYECKATLGDIKTLIRGEIE